MPILSEKNKDRLTGGIITLALTAGGYFLKTHFDKKEESKPVQKIAVTSNNSSKPNNTINQPFQTNNNKGDVKNEPVAGDKIKGDKVGGDKVMRDKVDNSNHVDNRTMAPVVRNDTTININPKPEPRTLNDNDMKRLNSLKHLEPLIINVEVSQESLAFAEEIRRYLLSRAYSISQFTKSGNITIMGSDTTRGFAISANSITILRQRD